MWEVKADILALTSWSIRLNMARSYTADEIGMDHKGKTYDGDAARFIRDRLLFRGPSLTGLERYWFNEDEFVSILYDEKERDNVASMLTYLETLGIFDLGENLITTLLTGFV